VVDHLRREGQSFSKTDWLAAVRGGCSSQLPDEQSIPEQIETFAKYSRAPAVPAEPLYRSARELKAAWLRSQNPDWREESVAREVTRAFPNPESVLSLLFIRPLI
jgi:hypothetical protein